MNVMIQRLSVPERNADWARTRGSRAMNIRCQRWGRNTQPITQMRVRSSQEPCSAGDTAYVHWLESTCRALPKPAVSPPAQLMVSAAETTRKTRKTNP
jgi:hypothetical protein